MVPEEPLADPAHTSAIGYGASKFVTENVRCLLSSLPRYPEPDWQVLGKAAQHGVPCTSLRVGQVCGANSSGAWATTEWVPIMLKSSVTLKALPGLEGVSVSPSVDSVSDAHYYVERFLDSHGRPRRCCS